MKQKRKKELELISYDELLGSSSMTGLVSFLEIRPGQAASGVFEKSIVTPTVGDTPTVGSYQASPLVPQPVNHGITETTPRDTEGLSTTVGQTPTVGHTIAQRESRAPRQASRIELEQTGQHAATPTVGDSPTVGVTPISGGLWSSVLTGSSYEEKRVQRVAIAQQSMSLGEERVYQAIWNARPTEGIVIVNRRVKSFSMGYDRLAKLTRLNEKSIRDIIPKLIDKKILEIIRKEDSWSRTGRTYQIFNYEEILERQRMANLCYVVKNGRAVEFVRNLDRTTEGETPTVGDMPTVGVSTTGTVGDTGAGTVGHTPTPIDKARQTMSQTSSAVREALSHYTTADEAAVRRIINACKAHVPDCTGNEIAHFIHEKSVLVTMRGSSIRNPMGHFIATVPQCFEGETFQLWRQAKSEIALSTEPLQVDRANEWGREHEADLDDPNVPEEVKRVIRACLGGQKRGDSSHD